MGDAGWHTIERALGEALGRPVRVASSAAIGGGCISAAARVDTSAGPFFVKTHATPLPGLFTGEAAGLQALRASACGLVVPEVVAARDPDDSTPGYLVLEYLPPGRPGSGFDARLGRGLAALHRTSSGGRGFGFERDTRCGATLQPNAWREDWVSFYGTQRLGHQARLGRDAGRFSAADVAVFDRVIARLDALVGDAEPPALVHGDLWSGNLYVTADGAPALVDPAVSYSHREAELGMMTLFGGFSDAVFAAYAEAWPLAPGWRERNAVYRLYHVMNHANLFGGGYVAQAVRLARACGGAF